MSFTPVPFPALSLHFSPGVRTKGFQLQRKGKVRIRDGDELMVRGVVSESVDYECTFELDENELIGYCDCPYLETNETGCRHLWALALQANMQGYLSALRKSSPRNIEFYPFDGSDGGGGGEGASYPEWTDLEEDVDEDYEEDEPPETTSFPAYPLTPGPNAWNAILKHIETRQQVFLGKEENLAALPGEILYCIDLSECRQRGRLTLFLAQRTRKKDGSWGQPKAFTPSRTQLNQFPRADQRFLAALLGAEQPTDLGFGFSPRQGYFYMDAHQQVKLLPLMGAVGRLYLREDRTRNTYHPLRWDRGPGWQMRLTVVLGDSGSNYVLSARFHRGEESLSLGQVQLVAEQVILHGNTVSRVNSPGHLDWSVPLKVAGPLTIPKSKIRQALGEILSLPRLPEMDLPKELRIQEIRPDPTPLLKVSPARHGGQTLEGEVGFQYGEIQLKGGISRGGYFDRDADVLIRRDPARERDWSKRLAEFGLRLEGFRDPPVWIIPPKQLPEIVAALTAENWQVLVDGKAMRRPGKFDIAVTSGIDWFDLQARVEFDGQEVPLPQLLKAIRSGADTIVLDDGSIGILPQEWLRKIGFLADLGKAEGENIRFRRHQAGLLDVYLAEQPDVRIDETFRKIRTELASFDGIQPESPPEEFHGTLRDYQRDGLGWFRFLQRFGFGGCLADDMGLGKTIQVLALLCNRSLVKKEGSLPPSLVVAPRSLIFNWKNEAARFAPHLKVLDHTGVDRARSADGFADQDLVLLTYGILRRDIDWLKDFEFDYCILDEAQAVKNAESESAKAVRLLQGRHRLALSGTPVENHLGELWSLFEYLNPGLLGSATVFQKSGLARNPDPYQREMLARGLHPFLLRRTKEQVAPELPEKTEQVLWCEMDKNQQKLYDELREHYRSKLLGSKEVDLKKAKIHVLEALLRLRQAACHPGLIDSGKADQPSAKLDVLLPQLQEVLDENHKVLIFSQFTSLLSIVRARLDRDRVPYEYLDGRTRDRQARVDRFQDDPDCRLFLVSLKAGGVGLNLTAAEYVYLLDPWWNPAVEAQAIDRAHRIGQTRPVFAYRIIARNTVEEKVLELQKNKRALAEAILTADNALLRDLQREDLELLLS